MIKIQYYIIIFLLSILSGILGRMGGAENYHTLYRDIGCSIISLIAFCIAFEFKSNHWGIYFITFMLHWGAYSTYYDSIFKFDNFWFSGFMIGMAIFPLIFIYKTIPFFIVRSLLLALIWGLLNKYLPNYIFCLIRKDIAEEFLRYFSVIITYLIK